MFDIAIKNRSTAVSDAELSAALPGFQAQISKDFTPFWGTDAKLTMVGKSARPKAHQWQVVLLDTSDEADALGYHDVTADGTPLGKVFVKSTIDEGGLWTVTFSHEVLEMLVDPEINLCAVDERHSRIYAYEVCDAVEADVLAYKAKGVPVSDFVLPNWFEPGATGTKRSFRGNVSKAFELAKGGYISYLDFGSGKGWEQIDRRLGKSGVAPGSRKDRRTRPIEHRVRSKQ